MFFFFKQKTAYEMRISDWSSDVCSSDLARRQGIVKIHSRRAAVRRLVPVNRIEGLGSLLPAKHQFGAGRAADRIRDIGLREHPPLLGCNPPDRKSVA